MSKKTFWYIDGDREKTKDYIFKLIEKDNLTAAEIAAHLSEKYGCEVSKNKINGFLSVSFKDEYKALKKRLGITKRRCNTNPNRPPPKWYVRGCPDETKHFLINEMDVKGRTAEELTETDLPLATVSAIHQFRSKYINHNYKDFRQAVMIEKQYEATVQENRFFSMHIVGTSIKALKGLYREYA